MSLQAQMSQAKEAKELFISHKKQAKEARELFFTHRNNLIKHMIELKSDGNEAGLKVFCNQMKAHGLDASVDYNNLCSGARINQVRCFILHTS